ncbi:MAG: hypothetical protein ABEJ59_01930 [Halanaeroarchaeum sp.]
MTHEPRTDGGTDPELAPIERLRWRLGWHPRWAVGGGAVAGFLVGNVLVTWSVRATMLRSSLDAATAPLRDLVGSGTAYLLALATIPVVVSILGGALVGVLVWFAGLRTVRQRLPAVRRGLLPGDGGVRYVAASGSVPLLDAGRRLHVTEVASDGRRLRVDRSVVALPTRTRESTGSATVVLSAVSRVSFDDVGVARIETDEETVTFPTDERPEAVYDAVAGRREVIGDVA